MEDTWGRSKNPKYLVAGKANGKLFASTSGETVEELEAEVTKLGQHGDVPVASIFESDVYVKIEDAVLDYRNGLLHITLPNGEACTGETT